jgi:hypothetical protein
MFAHPVPHLHVNYYDLEYNEDNFGKDEYGEQIKMELLKKGIAIACIAGTLGGFYQSFHSFHGIYRPPRKRNSHS